MSPDSIFIRIVYACGKMAFSSGFARIFSGTPASEKRRFLVVRRGAIGDVLMSTPLVRALRENFPDSYIAYLTGEWSTEAIASNPHLNEVITFRDRVFLTRFSNIGEKLKVIKKLRRKKFDTVISLDAEFWFNVYLAFTGACTRVGFDIEGSGFSLTHRVKSSIDSMHSGARHRVELFLKLLEPIGVNFSSDKGIELNLKKKDIFAAMRFLTSQKIYPDSFFVAIAPGGAMNPGMTQPAKCWQADKFAQVARGLMDRFNAKILLLGKGERDFAICESVKRLSDGGPINCVNKFSLAEATAIIEKSSLFISNDSGLMHAASSTKVPLVVIFGPTNPKDCGPYTQYGEVVKKTLACSNCYASQCVGHECMELISPDEVLSAVENAVKKHGIKDYEVQTR